MKYGFELAALAGLAAAIIFALFGKPPSFFAIVVVGVTTSNVVAIISTFVLFARHKNDHPATFGKLVARSTEVIGYALLISLMFSVYALATAFGYELPVVVSSA